MQVIYTKNGQAVAVENREPAQAPTTAREEIGRMFDFFSGFAGWKRPLQELEDLYIRGADEALQDLAVERQRLQAEKESFEKLPWWKQAWLRFRQRVPKEVGEVYSLDKIVRLYIDKLRRFKQWMEAKRFTRFYADSFGSEIGVCENLIARLEKRVAAPK